MLDRRRWSAAMLGSLAMPSIAPAAGRDVTGGANILRIAFPAAETGFDPPQVNDLYSRTVTAHIFESPYCYDPLALPVKVRPLTAAAMPEVSSDFRVWTISIQRGIYFADDPAFKGSARELVARDYAYALQRIFDPALKSPRVSTLEEEGIEGMEGLRAAALRDRKPFDYDAPIAGLRVLDRYTLQIRLATTRPRFLAHFCDTSGLGAVAREVVEFYGDNIMAHPVGTGPYRLKEWRRSSRIVLERNPGYRDVRYDAEPAPDDVEGRAWLARFKGRRLPFNDGVEVSILEEGQSRWLSFLNGQVDCVAVPLEFGNFAAPTGTLAPNLAKRGIVARKYVNPDITFSFWNMDDPVVGGYAPERVALRRAMALAYDIGREIRIARRGQAVAAQAAMPPGTFGYDPSYRNDNNSAYDPVRAKALLDTFGYLDRDGDGWREQPNGEPLVVTMSTQASQTERQFNEIWQKSMAAVGLRMKFNTAQWPENLKAARVGKLQMWSLADSAESPDAQASLEYMYSPSIGSNNLARFKLAAFDALFRGMQTLPDGPERAALFIEASKLVSAYMPYKIHAHRVVTDLNHPWAVGYRKMPFRNEAWQFVEVDPAMRERMTGAA